jgi:hypothetical protein
MRQERFTRGRLAGGAAVLGVLLTAGCGAPSVSGKVTFNGQPLNGGAVTFHGADGQTGMSWIDPEGNYSVPKAPAGEVKVTVVVAQSRPRPELPIQKEVPVHPGNKGGGEPAGKPVTIPDKYK